MHAFVLSFLTLLYVVSVPGASLQERWVRQEIPVNEETAIRYVLSEPARVRLVIYDALGGRVRTLIGKEQQTAGQYSVHWEGKDDGGDGVSTGVYFCCLDAGEGYRQVKRMMLLR